MMKWAGLFYMLRKGFSENPEGTVTLVAWLISAAIESAIVSLVIAGIAKLVNEKVDFKEWFKGAFIVVGILEIIALLVL